MLTIHRERCSLGNQEICYGRSSWPTCREGSVLTSCDLIPERRATAANHRAEERAFLAAHRRSDTGTDTG